MLYGYEMPAIVGFHFQLPKDPKRVNALDALHSRVSTPRLTDPPPSAEALENIYKAAFRAADHGLLRPWRFLVIQGDSRQKLGDLFIEAALAKDPDVSDIQQEKIRSKPMRAPMVIVTIAVHKEHPKVPMFEMDLSAAAATQNMLLAAHAQGVGAMWRTGSMAFDRNVAAGLGLAENEKIIGFLYLGTALGETRNVILENPADFFTEWP